MCGGHSWVLRRGIHCVVLCNGHADLSSTKVLNLVLLFEKRMILVKMVTVVQYSGDSA
jgi:hypothetical protein